MELGSPALQADSLLSEPPRKLQYKIKSSKEKKGRRTLKKKILDFGGRVAGDATKRKRKFRRMGLGWKTLARA